MAQAAKYYWLSVSGVCLWLTWGGPTMIWGRDTKVVNLGTVPVGDANRTVRVVPWGTIPGDIQQMATVGDGLFFATREGRVWQYDAAGHRNTSPFLDLSLALPDRFKVTNGNGLTVSAGLRGIAFHPDYDRTGMAGFGKFYTMHAETFGSHPADYLLQPQWTRDNTRLDSVIVEWTRDEGTGQIRSDSARDVLRVQYPFGRHPGQQISFNPHAAPGDDDYGLLYAAFGDAGSQDSDNLVNYNRVQGTDTLLGKIVRINPLANGTRSYTVPATNPFFSPTDGALDEIYAYGFRHPQTLAFDPATGRLFSGDMGQSNVEEVNLIESGGNYGYGTREGTYIFTDQVQGSTAVDSSLREVYLDTERSLFVRTDANPTGANVVISSRIDDPYTYAVAQFDHQSQGVAGDIAAVVAGSVYRGIRAMELEGLYLFGNLSNDHVFYTLADNLVNDDSPEPIYRLPLHDADGVPRRLGEIVGVGVGGRVDFRFGQDRFGDIYLISKANDTIYRLEGTQLVVADLNRDGAVDAADTGLLFSNWGMAGVGDLDNDGIVDAADAGELFAHWTGDRTSTARDHHGAVPEPARLFFWGGTMLYVWWRRHQRGRVVHGNPLFTLAG